MDTEEISNFTEEDIEELTKYLPKQVRDTLMAFFDVILNRRISLGGAPKIVRAWIANMLGHNIIDYLKDTKEDSPVRRRIVGEILGWAFDLGPSWDPKWAD